MKTTEKRSKIIRNGKLTRHDSIFIDETFILEPFDDENDFRLERYIDEVEQEAERLLRRKKLWPYKYPNMSRIHAAIQIKSSAENNSPEYFAGNVIWCACELRKALEKEDARQAADWAIRMTDNRYHRIIRDMEFAAVTGNKSELARRKANENRIAASITKNESIVSTAKRKMAANPEETTRSLTRVEGEGPHAQRKSDTSRKRLQRALKRAPE